MYDVIVLGDGLIGLACAALLSGRQHHTLLIGSGKAYREEEYPFYHMDCERGALGAIIRELQLPLAMKPVDIIDRAFFPDHEIERSRSFPEYRCLLFELFPEAEKALKQYFHIIEALGEEWLGLMRGDLDYSLRSIPFCIRYSRFSYISFIHSLFKGHTELCGVLCADMPTPDIALTVMAGYIYGQIFDGGTVQGGLSEVRKQLAAKLDNPYAQYRVTGERYLWSETENGGAIVYSDEGSYSARYVIDTFSDGSGSPHASPLSLFSLLASVPDGEFRLPSKEIWRIYPEYDVPGLLDQAVSSSTPEAFPMAMWSINDSDGEADGTSVIRIDVPVRGGAVPESFRDTVLRQAEHYLPGIFERKETVRVLTPLFHESVTGISLGAGYCWASSVKQAINNPVAFEQKNRYYNTSRWGFAWFSAAWKASNRVAGKLQAVSR